MVNEKISSKKVSVTNNSLNQNNKSKKHSVYVHDATKFPYSTSEIPSRCLPILFKKTPIKQRKQTKKNLPNINVWMLKHKRKQELRNSELVQSDEWSEFLNNSPYWQYESLQDIKNSIDGKLHLPKSPTRSDYIKLVYNDVINCISHKKELYKTAVEEILNSHNKDWGFPSSNSIR